MTVVERVRLFLPLNIHKKYLHTKFTQRAKVRVPKFWVSDPVTRWLDRSFRAPEMLRDTVRRWRWNSNSCTRVLWKINPQKVNPQKLRKSQVLPHFSIEYTPRPRSDVSIVTLPSTPNRERASGPWIEVSTTHLQMMSVSFLPRSSILILQNMELRALWMIFMIVLELVNKFFKNS